MNVPSERCPCRRSADAERSMDVEPEQPRVLLVDDDERNLLAVASVLEDLGEVVTRAVRRGGSSPSLEGEFAVILLDVYMPGMDGYETAQIIRSRDQTKGIPIVFLSAVNKETEHLLRGYAMGAVDYVFKPVDPVILRSKVAVFVDLFAKSKEVERKARYEQALLDANSSRERRAPAGGTGAAPGRATAGGDHPVAADGPLSRALRPRTSGCRTMSAATSRRSPALPSRRWRSGPRSGSSGSIRKIATGSWRPQDAPEDGPLSVEYRWQCADGNYKHFLDQAVLLGTPRGEPIEFAGTLIDISDQRSLESQLIQAQKMDAIGKLTGGIAHDFNNLLAAVIGGLGLLDKRAELEEEQQRILDMTRRAAEQGSELVRRLLAFARRQKLEPQADRSRAGSRRGVGPLTHTLGGLVEVEWRASKHVWRRSRTRRSSSSRSSISSSIPAMPCPPAARSRSRPRMEASAANWAGLPRATMCGWPCPTPGPELRRSSSTR